MVRKAPLDGFRVIELGDFIAGPYAATLLGDFGAEVIKIDLPGQTSYNRLFGGVEPEDPERSPFFVGLSRNKKSVSLDIRKPAGRELFLALLEKSDVLIENFRPGMLERWELAPDVLQERNPDLVIARVSGFGQTGPLRNEVGVDTIAQAYAGISYVTGDEAGPPTHAGVIISDYSAGLMAAFGVTLALLARTGPDHGAAGQVVDVALYEPLLHMLCEIPVRYQRRGEVRERMGNYYPGVTPVGTFQAGDSAWVEVSAASPELFRRLAQAVGRRDWLEDERLQTNAGRDEHRGEIEAHLALWFRSRSADEAVGVLRSAKIPASRVRSIAEIMADPHVAARQNFVRVNDPRLGEIVAAGPLPRLTGTPGSVRTTAPRPGEHNDEVYGGLLGRGAEELETLRREGVI